MKKINLLLMCCLPVALFAQMQPQFTINGNVKNVNPDVSKIYVSYAAGGQNVLDSVNVSGHSYKIQGYITQPTRVDLRAVYKTNLQPSMQRDMITLFVEPSDINIVSADSFSNATITGSKVNVEFQKMQTAAKPFEPRTQQLIRDINHYKKINDEAGLENAEKQKDALDAEMKEKVYADYIRQNPNSSLAFFALQQFSGGLMPNPQETMDLFNLLPERMQQSRDGQRYHSLITRVLRASVGNPALDFTQTDMNGNSVTLSSLKGKIVLLNFWASWCGPCRALDSGLVQLYNNYKDNNFVIVNVSLDKPGEKQDWLKAIQDDKLNDFINVTDLRFWNNGASQLYGIAILPQNFLINASGEIVGKNLKPNELKEKLNALLGNSQTAQL